MVSFLDQKPSTLAGIEATVNFQRPLGQPLILSFPVRHEAWFYAVAVLLSVVFGIRGIVIKKHEVDNENLDLKEKKRVEWTHRQRIVVHYFQDFIYNLVGSLTGWMAFYVLSYRLFLDAGPGVPPFPEWFILSRPNTEILGGFDLALVVGAFLGIAGKLAHTVERFILSIGSAVDNITGAFSKSAKRDA